IHRCVGTDVLISRGNGSRGGLFRRKQRSTAVRPPGGTGGDGRPDKRSGAGGAGWVVFSASSSQPHHQRVASGSRVRMSGGVVSSRGGCSWPRFGSDGFELWLC